MTRLFELAARRRLAPAHFLVPIALASAVVAGCYSIGDGTPPPPATFYFPVGLTVSRGGNVLYVVNSDFDLQWNGGTVQSYDLYGIRQGAAISAAGYSLSRQLPLPDGGGYAEFRDGGGEPDGGGDLCAAGESSFLADGGFVSACAPFINSAFYVRDSVTIGAFATDIQLSPWGNRLYAPVRGDASLTWLSVSPDLGGPPPSGCTTASCYSPFTLQCGQDANGGRCDATHHAGVNPNEPGNTRNLTMPGEPFAMAQSADGTAIVLTHQSEGDTSLFLTGLTPDGGPASPNTPSMQFVVDAGLPTGGDGIANVPHDPAAFGCPSMQDCDAGTRPAFLETFNTAAQLNLIRYYADDGTTAIADASVPDANIEIGSTYSRPFIEVESPIPITALSSGTDSRGIAFDSSARLACEHTYPFPDPRYQQCGQLHARVFIANRAPASLLIGTAGGPNATDDSFNPDAIVIASQPALPDPGASRVYLAPIIDADGDYALRAFVVCFDGNAVDIVDPDLGTVEARIAVGEGPFAITFDPFSALDVALKAHVQPVDAPVSFSYTPDTGGSPVQIPLPKYRFAYVASFTNSYVQVIDLDNSEPNKSTFETVVYTLGTPSVPKGNQ
jgi:DNA-binding beta-propeller fold protein YncE